MATDRPIFLLGPGRSGSTLLNNLLTHHRDVGYFVSWSNRLPRCWFLAVGARLRSWRLEARGTRLRFYPGPTEAYGIWKHCFPDFWRDCLAPCRDVTAADRLRRLIRRHLVVQRKTRFVAKLTGPPMFEFFRSIFPDARFVWVDRDPRAVVYSYSKGRKVVLPPGLAPKEAQAEALRQSARRYLDIYDRLAESAENFHLMIYGDFVKNPLAELAALLDYAELRSDPRLDRITRRWQIRDADDKWSRELSKPLRELLCELVDRPLRERGYPRD